MRTKQRPSIVSAALLGLCAALPAHAEDVSPESEADDDSVAAFAGASSVTGELANAAEERRNHLGVGALHDALEPWYAWKQGVLDDTGLQIGLSYSALYQRASRSRAGGEREAAGGIARFYGSWTLLGRGTKNEGAFVYRVEHRHKLGTDVPPTALGPATGSVTGSARTFSDFQLGATIAFWRQRFFDGDLVLVAGRVDPTDYFDMYALNSSQTHFMNGAFGTMPTVDAPSFGFGAGAGAMLADEIYSIVGFSDATGSPTQSRWSDVRDDNEWFQHAEIGWTPDKDDVARDNVHLAYWRMDHRDAPDLSHNWGLNLSGSFEYENGFTPFVRAGYSSGNTATLDRVLTIGAGQVVSGADLIGVGASWGRPSDSDLDDQGTLEVFYRIQLAENVQLTPDLQLIVNPALDPDEDTLWIAGLRLRITF